MAEKPSGNSGKSFVSYRYNNECWEPRGLGVQLLTGWSGH